MGDAVGAARLLRFGLMVVGIEAAGKPLEQVAALLAEVDY
jgi:hypothetical protein